MLKNNLDTYNDSAVAFDKKISALTNYDEAYDFFASLLGKKSEILDTACGWAWKYFKIHCSKSVWRRLYTYGSFTGNVKGGENSPS